MFIFQTLLNHLRIVGLVMVTIEEMKGMKKYIDYYERYKLWRVHLEYKMHMGTNTKMVITAHVDDTHLKLP